MPEPLFARKTVHTSNQTGCSRGSVPLSLGREREREQSKAKQSKAKRTRERERGRGRGRESGREREGERVAILAQGICVKPLLFPLACDASVRIMPPLPAIPEAIEDASESESDEGPDWEIA